MAEGISKIGRGLKARFVDGTWLGKGRCVTGGHGAHATGNAGQWYPVYRLYNVHRTMTGVH